MRLCTKNIKELTPQTNAKKALEEEITVRTLKNPYIRSAWCRFFSKVIYIFPKKSPESSKSPDAELLPQALGSEVPSELLEERSGESSIFFGKDMTTKDPSPKKTDYDHHRSPSNPRPMANELFGLMSFS